eukprot:6196748-Pleurochrysis_carterae.AAC.1
MRTQRCVPPSFVSVHPIMLRACRRLVRTTMPSDFIAPDLNCRIISGAVPQSLCCSLQKFETLGHEATPVCKYLETIGLVHSKETQECAELAKA